MLKYTPKIKKCKNCGFLYSSLVKECPMCKYKGMPSMHQKKISNKAYDELKRRYDL